jgi:hypothetical protein
MEQDRQTPGLGPAIPVPGAQGPDVGQTTSDGEGPADTRLGYRLCGKESRSPDTSRGTGHLCRRQRVGPRWSLSCLDSSPPGRFGSRLTRPSRCG